MATPTFLTAEWRKLAMANYAVEDALLQSFVPAGTELDHWQGKCYLSLVGFMFLNTRLRGFAVPCHANFEEVNIRFYVRYNDNGNWKRGVVFVSEIVPRLALTVVANRLYKEHYRAMRMRHQIVTAGDELQVAYSWRRQRWNTLSLVAENRLQDIEPGSEAEFITEHYWGYSKQQANVTSQYEVQHPRWQQYAVTSYAIDVDFERVYGRQFAFLQEAKPASVILAEGSPIAVKAISKIFTV